MNKKSGLVLLLIMGCCISSVSSMEIDNKKSYIKIKNGLSKIKFAGETKSVHDWVWLTLHNTLFKKASSNEEQFSLTYIIERDGKSDVWKECGTLGSLTHGYGVAARVVEKAGYYYPNYEPSPDCIDYVGAIICAAKNKFYDVEKIIDEARKNKEV